MNERKKMSKTTTHRDPIKRAARIERRAQKRLETVMRKKSVKKMTVDASVLCSGRAATLLYERTHLKYAHDSSVIFVPRKSVKYIF